MPRLDILFDFSLKELVIQFPDKPQASAYQKKNPEARIYSDHKPYEVYLPIPPRMQHIRASSRGFIFVFDEAKGAREWSKRVILGDVLEELKEVNIRREWSEDTLLDKLGLQILTYREGGRLATPGPPSSRGTSAPSDRFKDGVGRAFRSRAYS